MNKPPETYAELADILNSVIDPPEVATIVENDSGQVLTQFTFKSPDNHRVTFTIPVEMLERHKPEIELKVTRRE
jgi:hypothetical protein